VEIPEFIIFTQSAITSNPPSVRAGEIILHEKKVFLGCSDGALELKKIQFPGKAASLAFPVIQNLLTKTGQTHLKLTKFLKS
jgi:methionyl-tRNA formyltransferase